VETVPRGDDIDRDHNHLVAIHCCERVAYEPGQIVHWIDHPAARDNAQAVALPELQCV
jgi:hypothetical protein